MSVSNANTHSRPRQGKVADDNFLAFLSSGFSSSAAGVSQPSREEVSSALKPSPMSGVVGAGKGEDPLVSLFLSESASCGDSKPSRQEVEKGKKEEEEEDPLVMFLSGGGRVSAGASNLEEAGANKVEGSQKGDASGQSVSQRVWPEEDDQVRTGPSEESKPPAADGSAAPPFDGRAQQTESGSNEAWPSREGTESMKRTVPTASTSTYRRSVSPIHSISPTREQIRYNKENQKVSSSTFPSRDGPLLKQLRQEDPIAPSSSLSGGHEPTGERKEKGVAFVKAGTVADHPQSDHSNRREGSRERPVVQPVAASVPLNTRSSPRSVSGSDAAGVGGRTQTPTRHLSDDSEDEYRPMPSDRSRTSGVGGRGNAVPLHNNLPPLPKKLHVHKVAVTWMQQHGRRMSKLPPITHSRFGGGSFSSMFLLASEKISLKNPLKAVEPYDVQRSTKYPNVKEQDVYIHVEYSHEKEFSDETLELLEQFRWSPFVPKLPAILGVEHVALLPTFNTAKGQDRINFNYVASALGYRLSNGDVISILEEVDRAKLEDLVSDSVVKTCYNDQIYQVHDVNDTTPQNWVSWLKGKQTWEEWYLEKHGLELTFTDRPMLVSGTFLIPPEVCEIVSGVTGQMQWVAFLIQTSLPEIRKVSALDRFCETVSRELSSHTGDFPVDEETLQLAIREIPYKLVGERVLSCIVSFILIDSLFHVPVSRLADLRDDLMGASSTLLKVGRALGAPKALQVGLSTDVTNEMIADTIKGIAGALYAGKAKPVPVEAEIRPPPNVSAVLSLCQKLLLPNGSLYESELQRCHGHRSLFQIPSDNFFDKSLSNSAHRMLTKLYYGLQKQGYTFANKALLYQSFIIPRFNTIGASHDLQLLNFLGDVIIRLVVSTHFFHLFPNVPSRTFIDMHAVYEKTHSERGMLAKELKLDKIILECNPHLSQSAREDLESGNDQNRAQSLLSWVFSALIGAVHLDATCNKGSFPATFEGCLCGQDVAGGLIHSMLLHRRPELLQSSPPNKMQSIEGLVRHMDLAQFRAKAANAEQAYKYTPVEPQLVTGQDYGRGPSSRREDGQGSSERVGTSRWGMGSDGQRGGGSSVRSDIRRDTRPSSGSDRRGGPSKRPVTRRDGGSSSGSDTGRERAGPTRRRESGSDSRDRAGPSTRGGPSQRESRGGLSEESRKDSTSGGESHRSDKRPVAAAEEEAVIIQKAEEALKKGKEFYLKGQATEFSTEEWQALMKQALHLYTDVFKLVAKSDLENEKIRDIYTRAANNTAQICKLGRDFEAVIEMSNKVLAVDPNSAKAHYRKAFALRELKRDTEALQHAKRAKELQPDDKAIRELFEILSTEGEQPNT